MVRVSGLPQNSPIRPARSKSGSIRTWSSSARGAGPRASRRSPSRRSSHRDAYRTTPVVGVSPDGSRSDTSPVAAAWVPPSDEGDDVEVNGFALPVTGSHLLVRLCLPSGPLDVLLPSGLRLRPISIRPRCQGVPHDAPDSSAILMPKAKLILESICERTTGMPPHRPAYRRSFR
jgi:hypothetical protein